MQWELFLPHSLFIYADLTDEELNLCTCNHYYTVIEGITAIGCDTEIEELVAKQYVIPVVETSTEESAEEIVEEPIIDTIEDPQAN